MSYDLRHEIEQLLDNQQKLTAEENGSEYIIQGIYQYSLNYNDCIFQVERDVKFVVQKNFPDSIPLFYVFDYPEEIEHIYKNSNVCLATIGEMLHFLN